MSGISDTNAQLRTLDAANRKGDHWTLDQIELVAEFADETAEELARTLGRTLYAVRNIRHLLARGEVAERAEHTKRASVTHIGSVPADRGFATLEAMGF